MASLLGAGMSRSSYVLLGLLITNWVPQLGSSISLSLYTAMVARYSGTTNRVGCGFGVFFVYLYTTFYGFCLDVTCYVYCAEIFPTYMRPTGMAISIVSYFAPALRKIRFLGAVMRQNVLR